jgi:hypothetical protein
MEMSIVVNFVRSDEYYSTIPTKVASIYFIY